MKTRASRTQLKTEVTGCIVIDDNFRLINISDTGALIISSQKLLLDNSYLMRFDFRDRSNRIHLAIKSLIVREKLLEFTLNKKGAKVPVYEVGLTFLDVSNEDVNKLKLLIAQKELMKVKQ